MRGLTIGIVLLILCAGFFLLFRTSSTTGPSVVSGPLVSSSVSPETERDVLIYTPQNVSREVKISIPAVDVKEDPKETLEKSAKKDVLDSLVDEDAPLKDKVPEGKWKRAYLTLRTTEREFCGAQEEGWILTSLSEEDFSWNRESESESFEGVVLTTHGKAPRSMGELNTCGAIQIPPAGEKVRLRLQVQAPELWSDASIHLRAMSKNWTLLKESHETVLRSSAWTPIQLVLEIPPETDRLLWGIKLRGAGKILVKDAILRRYR